jgi:hypothetical protein
VRFIVFENIVIRRIFGPERGGMIGNWRKLHNEELHQVLLGCLNNGDKMDGICGIHEEMENAYKILFR